jgi:F420-dependent oxidoreductase-like protein
MLNFGCALPQDTADYGLIERLAKESEKLGFDSIWLYDHFYDPYGGWPASAVLHPGPRSLPCYEVWTTLSALATVTSKIRLGTLTLCNSYRYPSVVAKMASTLDNISNGRTEIGIGAGWFKEEFDAYGIPFTDADTRIACLREGVQIMKKMWTEEKVTFKGKYYSVESAYCAPKPIQKPHPPIWIGGTVSAVMRVAAELADVWNIAFYPSNTPSGFRKKVEALERYCREIGRDPATLRKSWHGEIIIGDTRTDVEHKVQKLKPADMSMDEYRTSRIIGTPDECVAQIESLAKEGATYLIPRFPQVEGAEPMRLFANQVMARLR